MKNLVILIILLWTGNARAEPSAPIWDLREELEEASFAPLRYPWDIHWQELLGPADPVPPPTRVAKPPLLRFAENGLAGMGYATYRLRFKGLKPLAGGYEMKIHHEVSAYLALLYREDDPRVVYRLGNGEVGPNAAATDAQELPATVRFDSPSAETVWVVLVQIANFHHARGGMWRAPVIGAAPVLSQMTQREFDSILVAVGVQLVMGIYNFVIFLRRRQEFSSLLLAICCLLAMMRSVANGFLVAYFFPDTYTLGFRLQYSLDYMTMIALSCSYMAFIHSSYPGHLKAWEMRAMPWYLGLNAIFAVVPLVTETAFFTGLKNSYLTMTFGNLSIGFMILLRIVENKRASSLLAMIGFLLMFATACWDLLCSFNLVPEPFLAPYGLTAFIFLQSQVVAGRFAAAFRTAEHLSQKLRHEVSLQTAKLQMQREKLEKQHGDLLRSHRDLQAVHEEKNGFFRHISHEIRTPLTLILGTISNTRRSTQYEQGLNVIEKNSLRLLRLVNQLLDLQRYQSLKDPLQSLPLPFSQIMHNVTDYVQQTCQEMDIAFVWQDEIARADERILGQVDSLEKIVLNYLSNAMKYTPAGGTIRVRLEQRDRWLRCTVEDTGPGIPEEDLGQLFQVFSRLRDSDQKMREGTGLGLALCRELAASMQGRVGVASQLGVGSQFWMEFPRLLRPEEYWDLVAFLQTDEDAETVPEGVKQHAELPRCYYTSQLEELQACLKDERGRVVLLSHGSDTELTLRVMRELRQGYPDLILFLLIDQQERVEFVHQVMQTGAIEQVFYRPLQPADIEVLESYRLRELLNDKPIVDVLFLDDHADVRIHFSRAIAEHTLIETHISCQTLEEAKNALRRHRVKVVVSDLNLTAGQGYGVELLQFAARIQPEAFRVLLSAENSAYKIQEMLRAVAVHKLLFKPFLAERDMAVIQGFVDQSPWQPVAIPEDLNAKDRAALYVSDAIGGRDDRPVKTVALLPLRPLTARAPRILLVDDVMDMRQMIAEILNDAGMVVVECADGREALKHLHEDGQAFDLVISDWMMPRLSGLELLQAMRSQTATKDIPCILLTAKVKHEVEASLPSDGLTRYVAKPFDHLHFAELVQRMLPHAKAEPPAWQTLSFLQLQGDGLGQLAEEQGIEAALATWQGLEAALVAGAQQAGGRVQRSHLMTMLILFEHPEAASRFLSLVPDASLLQLRSILVHGRACPLQGEWLGPAIDELRLLAAHARPGQVICNAAAIHVFPDIESLTPSVFAVRLTNSQAA